MVQTGIGKLITLDGERVIDPFVSEFDNRNASFWSTTLALESVIEMVDWLHATISCIVVLLSGKGISLIIHDF